jgi:sulfotransferase family protein
MNLRVVGAGLPRTGTSSLRVALEHLLGGPCYHMSAIPGHPFNLGPGWNAALTGKKTDWERLFRGYVASVDWPAAEFWRELSDANPQAVVLLSLRENAKVWWQSANETILPVARKSMEPGWKEGQSLVRLLQRFTGTERWDDRATLMAAFDRHNEQVRQGVPAFRLLEWHPSEGWAPICRALHLPVPKIMFPWVNRRSEWG